MLWWERLMEIAAGLLTVAAPVSFAAFRNLKAPVFDEHAPAMVNHSYVFMQDKKGNWWQMQPAGMRIQNWKDK